MSVLAPFMLVLGGLAAAAAVALHLLTTRRPPKSVLPTARFVPVSDARAVARSPRPTDLLILACRALAALLLGAAFAHPVLDLSGPSVRSVVMLDRSASVADAGAAERLAAERFTVGGALVVFDTIARELPADTSAFTSRAVPRAASRAAPRAAPGILSAALLVATRAGRRVARGADSVRLVLVSPLAEEEFDAATDPLRAAWPGGIEIVRVAAVADTARGGAVRLVSALVDDPLAPALARVAVARGAHEVRIVRRSLSAADSAWAMEPERVLVFWPLPRAAAQKDAATIAEGVTVFGLHTATIVAPLVRLPLSRSSGAPRPRIAREAAGASATASTTTVPARVIARWRDGAVAATESPLAAGCIREVGVGIPLAGDLTLRAPFDRFLAVIVEPCGGARGRAVTDALAQRLAGGTHLASARTLAAGVTADSGVAALLFSLALAALATEWLLRRRAAS